MTLSPLAHVNSTARPIIDTATIFDFDRGAVGAMFKGDLKVLVERVPTSNRWSDAGSEALSEKALGSVCTLPAQPACFEIFAYTRITASPLHVISGCSTLVGRAVEAPRFILKRRLRENTV